MIKTVLFDLDDTIFDFKMSEKIAIIKTFESFGYDVTDEMILKYSQYNISQWKRLELGEISREEVKVNRFKLLFDDLGLDLSPKKTTLVYEENLAKGHYFVKGAEEMLNFIMIYTLFQTGLKKCKREEWVPQIFPIALKIYLYLKW